MSEREEGERGQGAWGSRGAGLEGERCRSLNPGVSVAQRERERESVRLRWKWSEVQGSQVWLIALDTDSF